MNERIKQLAEQAQQEEIARLVLKRRSIRDEAQDIKTHRDDLTS